MSRSEAADALDVPFPGAHPQVPRSHPAALPLDATRERWADGWVFRMRVHAERVTVSKEVVVSQRIDLRRNVVDDVVHVETRVDREQLQVETEGQVEITDSGDRVREADRQLTPNSPRTTSDRSEGLSKASTRRGRNRQRGEGT
jgi:uncharacterized protein (TIGR02271 family)